MKTFELSRRAYLDLAEIWDYIAEDSLDAADRVLEELYEACSALGKMPGMGHRRTDLTQRNVLFWPVGSYVVI